MPPERSVPPNTTPKPGVHYPPSFYERRLPASRRSAELTLAALRDAGASPPDRVVDVGCGRGAWLEACRELGASWLEGLDGPWNADHFAAHPEIRFVPSDLGAATAAGLRAATDGRTYDLGLSVEVVEHLPDASGRAVVEFLSSACDVVLFSAAIPGQGGAHHVNEQWPSYWAALFQGFGLAPFDVLRPRLWDNEEVEFWYRQNVLVYARPERLPHLEPADPRFLDLVHPRQLAHSRTTLRVGEAATALGAALGERARGVLRGLLRR